MAAPASDGSSLDDPAEGYVSDTVEVSEEGSVTTVRPVDFRVVMEGERGVAGEGVEAGMLFIMLLLLLFFGYKTIFVRVAQVIEAAVLNEQ